MDSVYPPLPDWIQAVELVGAGAINELIACLTPAKRFDTRGSVFYIHDFEHGWGMVDNFAHGAGSGVKISSAISQSGGLSAELTAGLGTGGTAGVYLYFPPLSSQQIGIQVSLFRSGEEEVIYLYLDYYDFTIFYRGLVGWDTVNQTVIYLDEEGDLQTIATGINSTIQTLGFLPIKLVVDFKEGKYVRFLFGKWEIDLSPLNLYREENGHGREMWASFEFNSKAGENAVVNIDDLILTIDEPV